MRAVSKLQTGDFCARRPEAVLMKTVIWKQVIQTDENDKAVLQIFESGTAFHLIQIDHTLIVSGAQGQILDAACLHLDVRSKREIMGSVL